MKIPVPLNYLDKLLLHNFHLKPYFGRLKMKIPVPLNYDIKIIAYFFANGKFLMNSFT